MATLTQTAYFARKAIKYGSIAIIALLILRSAFLSFQAYWKKAYPPPPPKATTLFGKLPKLKFPSQPDLPSITLRLETISGTLPKLPTQAKVFFIPKPAKDILAWDKIRTWAKTLGFEQNPQTLSSYDYRFTSGVLPKNTLDVNVITKNFSLNYDWKSDLQILSQNTPPSESQSISIAKGYLQTAQVLNDDLVNGPAEVIFLKYVNGSLTKALFATEANFSKVNLFRQNIDGLKVLPPNPKDANITALISPLYSYSYSYSNNGGIVELKYTYFSFSLNNFSTYPLKDVQQAWSQLGSGKGFIANLGNNPEGKVTIRNAYLAYYDGSEAQDFLQPVVVFEGDNDFFAYIPAVSDNWLEQ